MGSEAGAGGLPAVAEDTIDLGERLDPVRTLLRRTAAGDQRSAGALLDVLGPRIHGLAVHVTGSAARAERLTVEVLRSCLRDAGELAAGGLPGEAAVLDRARRAAVATRPSGDVRSLVSPAAANDRTRDRREVDVLRVLLALPPAQRALVESAAQGRFGATGVERAPAATALARVLDALVPLGGPEDPELRALAALDALALAESSERQRLKELTRGPETAGVHRHAIEAAARLTLLTAVPPSRDLHVSVLEGFTPPAAARGEAEAAYGGDYATPVLGTDSQRRLVGPPARAGAPAAVPAASGPTPATPAPVATGEENAAGPSAEAPAFAFRPGDEAERGRRARRRERRRARAGARRAPWASRGLAAVLAVLALVLAGMLLQTRDRLAQAEQFTDTWATLSLTAGAELVPGLSDNGTWQAVVSEDGVALRAEGVAGWDGEVLELWGVSDGVTRSLGVLDLSARGEIAFTSAETAERLVVTREMAPGSGSGSPSPRLVATLDPELTGA
jgi:hypothetical protein